MPQHTHKESDRWLINFSAFAGGGFQGLASLYWSMNFVKNVLNLFGARSDETANAAGGLMMVLAFIAIYPKREFNIFHRTRPESRHSHKSSTHSQVVDMLSTSTATTASHLTLPPSDSTHTALLEKEKPASTVSDLTLFQLIALAAAFITDVGNDSGGMTAAADVVMKATGNEESLSALGKVLVECAVTLFALLGSLAQLRNYTHALQGTSETGSDNKQSADWRTWMAGFLDLFSIAAENFLWGSSIAKLFDGSSEGEISLAAGLSGGALALTAAAAVYPHVKLNLFHQNKMTDHGHECASGHHHGHGHAHGHTAKLWQWIAVFFDWLAHAGDRAGTVKPAIDLFLREFNMLLSPGEKIAIEVITAVFGLFCARPDAETCLHGIETQNKPDRVREDSTSVNRQNADTRHDHYILTAEQLATTPSPSKS